MEKFWMGVFVMGGLVGCAPQVIHEDNKDDPNGQGTSSPAEPAQTGSPGDPGNPGNPGNPVATTFPADPTSGECSNGALSFGPAELPPAVIGQAYLADIQDFADQGWQGVEYAVADPPPPGLQLGQGTLELIGVPTELGLFQFTLEAVHAVDPKTGCTTQPDPHTFDIAVLEVPPVDTDTDGGDDTDGWGDTEGTGTDTGGDTGP